MDIEKFLVDIAVLFNLLRENPNDMVNIRDKATEMTAEFYKMKNSGIDYMALFETELAGDPELYLIVLSVLIFFLKRKEFLSRAVDVVMGGTLPYDTATGIMQQIGTMQFNDYKMKLPYETQRGLHAHMTMRLREKLETVPAFIPYEERNHNRILLSTDTFLSEQHAPTVLIMDIAQKLILSGFDVKILVSIEKADANAVDNCWLFPWRNHYMFKWNGEFERAWNGCKLTGYQQIVDTEHLKEARETLEEVVQWKPECVWHIGGESIFAELLGDLTTLASTACTNMPAISDAPVLVNYFPNDSYSADIEKFISEKRQRKLNFFYQDTTGPSILSNSITRKDLGLCSNEFAVAIAGNRLDDEIKSDFLNIMQEIVEIEPKVVFVMIGKTRKRWDVGILSGHVKCLGYRDDFVEVLNVLDLFLNYPRQGGGTVAACALKLGIPIITMPWGDVASVAGDDFFCEKLGDVPELVHKYYIDREYYHEQVVNCQKQNDKRTTTSDIQAKHIKKVILQISNLLQSGEIR